MNPVRRPLLAPLFALAVASAAVLYGTTGYADTPDLQAGYESRLATVESLTKTLQNDPAAKTDKVKNTLTVVEARRREAAKLADIGEYSAAQSVLDEGYRTLTTTLSEVKGGHGYIATADSNATDNDKKILDQQRADFERNLNSALSLREAASRVDAEKGNEHANNIAAIDALIADARNAAAKDDLEGADKLIQEALSKEQQLITFLKGGEGADVAVSTEKTPVSQEAKLKDFDSRLATAHTMLDALKRQDTERKGGKYNTISDVETKLSIAKSLRNNDLAAAFRLVDEAYESSQAAIRSMQTPSDTKTGSAVFDRDPAAGKTNRQKKATLNELRSNTGILRSTLVRQSRERKIDNTETLKQIDESLAESKKLEKTNLSRSLEAADEAHETARHAIDKLRLGL